MGGSKDALITFFISMVKAAVLQCTGHALSLHAFWCVVSGHALPPNAEAVTMDSVRVRPGRSNSQKNDSLVAHHDSVDLNHHPLQRIHGSKRELVARGPRGGEERHDEPERVE